jgi:hypothetical protein
MQLHLYNNFLSLVYIFLRRKYCADPCGVEGYCISDVFVALGGAGRHALLFDVFHILQAQS